MKLIASFVAASVALSTLAQAADSSGKYNVLMIAVDDLRPTFGCYGHPEIKTPHLDALAADGTLFLRAYTQQAVCAPSRTCLLTGRRPDTTKVYDLQTHFRKALPDVVALPQHFKQHGYHTQSLGKVYHSSLDDPTSWSEKRWDPGNSARPKPSPAEIKSGKTVEQVLERDPKTGVALKLKAAERPADRGPPWEARDVADDALGDGQTAKRAVELLGELKDRRFFLAVGFYKPHLPFVAPKRYFDLYPLESVALPTNPYPAKNGTTYSMTSFGELRSYRGVAQQGPMSEQVTRELRRAYYASASYTDALIGQVLAELKRLGLDKTTIVCVWGDHGWKLGEHGSWCKHTNCELDTNSPLIFRVPGQVKPGAKTKALSEFVDVYPTLAELCGLPQPEGVEGTSLAPVIAEPDRPWKQAAFSQYPRGDIMGYAMRTDRYRYIEWQDKGRKAAARELYDHQTDPDENANVVDEPANHSLVATLSKQLNAGWREALPK